MLVIMSLYCLLPIAWVGLGTLAWVSLYRRGAGTRDFVFWGPILIFVPFFGALALLVYLYRQGKAKRGLAAARA